MNESIGQNKWETPPPPPTLNPKVLLSSFQGFGYNNENTKKISKNFKFWKWVCQGPKRIFYFRYFALRAL